MARMLMTFLALSTTSCNHSFSNGKHESLFVGHAIRYAPGPGQFVDDPEKFGDLSVAPEDAIKLAEPYLARSLELRVKHVMPDENAGIYRSDTGYPDDFIIRQGESYFVTRDRAFALHRWTDSDAEWLMRYAVRVHGNTREVIPPTYVATK